MWCFLSRLFFACLFLFCSTKASVFFEESEVFKRGAFQTTLYLETGQGPLQLRVTYTPNKPAPEDAFQALLFEDDYVFWGAQWHAFQTQLRAQMGRAIPLLSHQRHPFSLYLKNPALQLEPFVPLCPLILHHAFQCVQHVGVGAEHSLSLCLSFDPRFQGGDESAWHLRSFSTSSVFIQAVATWFRAQITSPFLEGPSS